MGIYLFVSFLWLILFFLMKNLFSETLVIILVLNFFVLVPRSNAQNCSQSFVGFPPINDLGPGTWRGLQGGLYPEGQNIPPIDHYNSGIDIANHIVPLDVAGQPDSINGEIVFLSIGMSNTKQEFSKLKVFIDTLKNKNHYLKVINGAQPGWVLNEIVNLDTTYWFNLNEDLISHGLTSSQVQVIWLKETEAYPIKNAPDTSFQAYVDYLKDEFKIAIHIITAKFPNARLCYLASRVYGGYNITEKTPEPFAYYQGWAVKHLIDDQISGDTALVYSEPDPRSPWLLWGTYLWADGATPRSDGLTWICPEDYKDGVHLSDPVGQEKAAMLVLNFLLGEKTAQPWLLNNSLTDISTGETIIPGEFSLEQNYPNPFNPITTIEFTIPQSSNVRLKVYNLLGQEVRALVNGVKEAGTHKINFDAKELNSGMFIYKLEAGSLTQVRKMLLLK
ncbi:MAG: T9SS type A sorting domain-containing protein [Ignavibacteriales bacterium]|nr:T9SS type A sorting domain-containing protein [Ignavibacteriales bacterium]